MKNDKSQFVVRTSDFYLSLVIGHLPFDPRLVAKDFSSRNLGALGALRGFAVSPGLDFHREGAKHAKKTRRTLVWLRPGCSVFICGFIHTLLLVWLRCSVKFVAGFFSSCEPRVRAVHAAGVDAFIRRAEGAFRLRRKRCWEEAPVLIETPEWRTRTLSSNARPAPGRCPRLGPARGAGFLQPEPGPDEGPLPALPGGLRRRARRSRAGGPSSIFCRPASDEPKPSAALLPREPRRRHRRPGQDRAGAWRESRSSATRTR